MFQTRLPRWKETAPSADRMLPGAFTLDVQRWPSERWHVSCPTFPGMVLSDPQLILVLMQVPGALLATMLHDAAARSRSNG